MFRIQRFPDELLFQTFEWLSTNALDALAISHVDQRWRELSLKIPRLWSSLDSRLGPGSVHAFARRSRDLLLHVQVLHRNTDYVGAEADAIHAFMDAATAYFARWSTLTVDAISAHIVEMVLDRCRGIPEVSACRENQLPLPCMASVILRVHKNFAADEHYYHFSRIAPFHPQHLVLDGVAAWELGFCSHALERLELRNLSSNARHMQTRVTLGLRFLTEVLHACPNLQELVLDDASPIWQLGNPRPAVLQHLQVLRLLQMPADMAQAVLTLLSAPNLQSLHLHLAGTWEDLSQCLSLFPDNTAITHLHLACNTYRTFTNTNLAPAWESFPELSKLVLERTGISDLAVTALSALPKLQHLALRYESLVSPAAVESLLRARLEDVHASALHKLEIHMCKSFSTETMARLCSLVVETAFVVDGDDAYDSGEDNDYEPSEVSGDSDSVFSYSDY